MWIRQQLFGIVDHIPRAINICVAKAIPVVPRFHYRRSGFSVVILQNLLYFRFRKPKLLVVFHVDNGIHVEVVQSREDAFLRYPQASRQHRKLQEVVRLERLTEQSADQRDHFLVIAVLECLVQRHIVFVDKENYLLAVVLVQQGGKHFETFPHVIRRILLIQEAFK